MNSRFYRKSIHLICANINSVFIRQLCSTPPTKRICVVGAGPAGFYATQYLLKHLPGSQVDLLEKLPVPFGLVRYGVAPDHPEVKNVISTFTKTALNPNMRFLGNLSLGKDFTLKELREKYHAVLLTYGAEKDKQLDIPNEDKLPNVISAREFVAWYNGLPGAENLNPNLTGKVAAIIGQGNVAVDVARILLSPINLLEKTDITAHALSTLRESQIEKVLLIGRRGPLQAAFTIKELREMLKLPNCVTQWRSEGFEGVPELVPSLPRPRKRITELMLDSAAKQSSDVGTGKKTFQPVFLRSPKNISNDNNHYSIELSVNQLQGDKAIGTDKVELLPADLILRSIGYKSTNFDPDLNFNEVKGLVNNKAGRVLKKNYKEIEDSSQQIENGLYVAGWLATGPTGVILTTMNNAFSVAKTICDDFAANLVRDTDECKPGLDVTGRRIVTWEGWEKIDKAEIEAGTKYCKPREKLLRVEDMLKIVGV